MSILLTDEEIKRAYGVVGEYGTMERVAKAQLKKVVEWGISECPHDSVAEGGYFRPIQRGECPTCWQALQKEIE